MAFKRVGGEFISLKAGDKVEGYLVNIGQQYFPPKKGQSEGSTVPTFTLEKKDGTRVKLNLGRSVADDVAAEAFKIDAMTRVTKPKEKITTRSGNELVDWQVEQDLDDIRK